MKAQGAALGKLKRECQALKERDTWLERVVSPFQGLRCFIRIDTRGCAPGFRIMPFQGIRSATKN